MGHIICAEAIFEELITENFPKLMKDIKLIKTYAW